MRHQLLFYNETRFNHLLERLQIGLFNIQRPLQPRRWVEDCVLNHDSLYLHYDQLVTTEASTKISLYKVQRLCLVIVHHLQLQHLQLQHLLLFSRTNTISLSTQHHIHNPIATINNMHGPFSGHGHHEKDHGLLGKVFNHHR